MEERARQARNGLGWKDCGAEWREANSHASALIGLCEVLSVGYQWLTLEQVDRLRQQIIHGVHLRCFQRTGADRCADGGVHESPTHDRDPR